MKPGFGIFSFWLCMLFIWVDVSGQSYEIGSISVSFLDSSRDREIETKIFYPAYSTGDSASITSGNFPVLVFGHGFLMGYESYSVFWEELVPEGYIVCFPTTELNITPSHSDFGMDMRFIASKMILENQDPNSFFYSAIKPSIALMGHSMGGGASFIATENNESIATLVSFAAAETSPSAISAAFNIDVPTLVFSGEDDCVTPPDQHQIPMFENLPSDCKTHINIIDGGHCYFADDSFVCNIGESSCNSSLDISREEQHDIVFRFLKPWLGYTLYDRLGDGQTFQDSLEYASDINYVQSCNAVNVEDPIASNKLSVYPNPVSNLLHLEVEDNSLGGSFVLYNTFGEELLKEFIQSSITQFDLSNFPKGVYLGVYRCNNTEQSAKIMLLD